MVWSSAPPAATAQQPGRGAGEGTPASAGEPGRRVLGVLAAAVALTPMVAPKGAHNLAPIDGLIALAVLVAFLWALRRRALVRLPYAVPVTGLVVVGFVAALASVSPLTGGVAMVQELFLFAWCAALVTVCRTPRALGFVLRAWALSATAWAGVLVLAVLAGVNRISGAEGGIGSRAQLFFDHPNMAGNYFMIGAFIVVAAGCPRRLWARILACALLLVAMFFTGSNAALLSLILAGVLAVFLHLRARAGMVKAIAVVTAVVGLLGVGWVEIGSPLVAAATQSDNPLLRYSVGRGERSAEGRSSLFAEQFELYQRGDLLGIGPAGTRDALGAETASAAKEAHNDYLGALVERGPLGALALAGLVGVVGARAVRTTRRPLSPRLAEAVPVPAALVGACAAFAFTALTHEVLHYRWLWILFAMVAALHLLLRQEESDGGAPTGELPPPHGGTVPLRGH
ncbi:MAG TPA: O-antigen ligase family protein [Modestobacter sp.]|nr:O-antigen ligase family protein [Modestobacter sp.]